MTAILIVVTKDESSWSEAHDACSRYMETLISKLMFSGSMSVGAVEALLILAEWAPQRAQATSTIGRGEEDYGAWMQVGCAIRLGYLQRLEQTGLSQEPENRDQQLGRKRIAWAGKRSHIIVNFWTLTFESCSLLYERPSDINSSW